MDVEAKGILMMILGVFSILLPFIGLFFSIICIVMRYNQNKIDENSTLSKMGFIAAILGLIFNIFLILGYVILSNIRLI